MITFLLSKGANVSAQNNIGNTPFSLLDNEVKDYNRSLIIMIKEFLKLAFEKIAVFEADMKLIKDNPENSKYFEKCTTELN